MADDGSFGAVLRRLRVAADLTLERLAELSGVTSRAISDMERGVSLRPQARTAAALADGLGLSGADRALLLAARTRRDAPAPVGGLPLPRWMADFTGRGVELAQVADWSARESPVVVISGVPGVGKTSFAVKAAQAWDAADRFFVDMRGLDAVPVTAEAALGRLIRAVAPGEGALPAELEELSARWADVAGDRRMVVVLDNAADEAQVRPVLLRTGNRVTVLVTSRSVLGGLEGVRWVSLDRLPATEAVALLASIVDDQAAPEDGLRRIAELCAHTPLALRIAGNRLANRPGWTTGDLIARLSAQERRLDALTAGDLQVRAAIGLSYQQLSGATRRLFRRLALVPGASTGVELAAVLVGETPVVTEDALDELIELSLLQQTPDGRFQMHDLLRLYATAVLEREDDAGDRVGAVQRRDAWLLDTTIVAGRFFEPGYGPAASTPFDSQAAADEWLRAEADNWLPVLAGAAADGEDQRVVDVAESLHWFSDGWAYWPGWEDVFTLSSQAAQRFGDDKLQSTHLGYLAWVYTICRNIPDRAAAVAREALEHAEQLGGPAFKASSVAMDRVAQAEKLLAGADEGAGIEERS
ncbi:hypothetical protein GCM10010435_48210 [Winogradskya consettensis]|uniref:HTH cro/C1-type domain-containing protein n=1 Tax=Winogradskya consettensis TaxID=113560 RepID=A0A919VXR1_9ACTN|nr:XRE family transcriptional regulator [Actinoplanes consettensis]GIM73003.1 hypothetical protein Aco04nite_33140 [Actinoplanes consettensis]